MSAGRELVGVPSASVPAARGATRGGWLNRESVQGFLWIGPAFLYLAFFIVYPFIMAVYLSVSSARVGSLESHFVGWQNYTR
ncbi:MAG: hypothetical protein ACREKQ_05025, partial [Candidatus Rokuibacteriota bacterium]